MQVVIKDVVSEKKVVAQVEVPVFDNVDEAIGALGEEDCTALINRGNSVRIMDAKRREATGTGSTGIRALMAKLRDNPEILEKVRQIVGE